MYQIILISNLVEDWKMILCNTWNRSQELSPTSLRMYIITLLIWKLQLWLLCINFVFCHSKQLGYFHIKIKAILVSSSYIFVYLSKKYPFPQVHQNTVSGLEKWWKVFSSNPWGSCKKKCSLGTIADKHSTVWLSHKRENVTAFGFLLDHQIKPNLHCTKNTPWPF